MPKSTRYPVIIVGVVLAVILIGRACLPGYLKRQINHRLNAIPGYSGHVDDVGVHLLHGGYSMHRLLIEKRAIGQAPPEPLLSADNIDFTIAYRMLFHGQFVSDVELDRAAINFVNGPTEGQSQNLGLASQPKGHAPKPDQRWQDVVDDLFPIDITHFTIKDSRIHFLDATANPKIDLSVDHIEAEATGLRNRREKNGPALPAQIHAKGETIGRGLLHLEIAVEPLAQKPHFQLHLTLERLSLPALNPFLMAYANVDVSKGTLQFYTEINAENGSYRGYAKPIFTNLDFKTASDRHKGPFQLVWKNLVKAATNLLKDKNNKQVGTLVPFSGTFSESSSVDVWHTMGNLFRNGFIQALRRGLEGNAAATGEKPPG